MPEIPRIISVDDHVVEPPTVWTDRLPRKYLDVGPRVVRETVRQDLVIIDHEPVWVDSDVERSVDFWLYEDLKRPVTRLSAASGYPKEDVDARPINYEEMLPGCWQQQARLSDMDLNHVEAAMCFPMFPRFCGQTFMEADDKELALLCVQAYNDWMIEEWCAGTDSRLIPLPLIPLWDPHLAAAEVRRNAARGAHAVAFTELPTNLGLPSIHDADGHWEPLFEACEETATVLCMHIGSGSRMPSTSPDAPPAVPSTLTFNNAMGSLADWLFSGAFIRYPDIKIAYSEGQIGWIPYILERADVVWEHNRGWNRVWGVIPEPPSSYFADHVYGCFFDDRFGLANLDAIGVDNVTFETDYPHSDSTWPHTKEVAEKLCEGLSDEVIYKIMRGNAITMLHLPFED